MTRVAMIGAGAASGAHVQALHAMGCEIVSVVTRRPERARAVQELFPDARRCWPAAESLAGVDLAVVASPSSTHRDVVAEAARCGVDVVVEKPLGTGLEAARDLVWLARKAAIGLAVCFQHRAKPAGHALHRLARDGTLGAITGGLVHVPWWREQSYYDEPGRGTYERDGGGVLIIQAIHALDLALWCLGPPIRVAACGRRSRAHLLEAEDVLSGVLDYGDHLLTLHASSAAHPGSDEEIWLTGTEGTAVQKGAGLTLNGKPVVASGPISTASDPRGMPVEWHRALLEDALASFAERREPLASGGSALLTQSVVAALYRSTESGRWEKL